MPQSFSIGNQCRLTFYLSCFLLFQWVARKNGSRCSWNRLPTGISEGWQTLRSYYQLLNPWWHDRLASVASVPTLVFGAHVLGWDWHLPTLLSHIYSHLFVRWWQGLIFKMEKGLDFRLCVVVFSDDCEDDKWSWFTTLERFGVKSEKKIVRGVPPVTGHKSSFHGRTRTKSGRADAVLVISWKAVSGLAIFECKLPPRL